MAGGFTNLVSPQTLFNTAKKITTLTGEKDTETYFTDPSKQPPLQPKPDPKMMELQMKAEIEKVQAQADITTQNAKTQAEIALAQQKFELERELALIDAQLQREKHAAGPRGFDAKGPNRRRQGATPGRTAAATARTGCRHSATRAHAQTIQVTAAKADAEPKAKISAAINQFAKHVTEAQANHAAMLENAIKKANAPKRIVRDPKTNKISHIEVINEQN